MRHKERMNCGLSHRHEVLERQRAVLLLCLWLGAGQELLSLTTTCQSQLLQMVAA
jgi:hypothetical protein